jgi:MoaA/NifB/PqqE/SkfB family radical SAM enzyme
MALPTRTDEPGDDPIAPLRLEAWVKDLEAAGSTRAPLAPSREARSLPEPVFPRRPELLRDASADPVVQERHWTLPLVWRKTRAWLVPYLKSRVLPGSFHPILAYLFTDWKCNVDCHYCPSWDNKVPGMTEDVARRSIDWLASTTCRVVAVMGGEPLVRPRLVHKVVDYATSKGFWVYIGTNGQLLRPDTIDRLADAGMAVFNVAVDVVDEKPGLPKALNAIRPSFEYLLKKQYRYGYMVFFNICICRNNMDDVRELTEIARAYRIATDYHICESPMYTQSHFKHLDDNVTYITRDDWPRVDALVDWLIEKNQAGYSMVNSVQRLSDMKDFMRGRVESWNCRAGQNVVVIRTDGTLAPCFPLYMAGHDWGCIEKPRFDRRQLDEMKVTCQANCFSTLQHNVGFCYNDRRVIRWVGKQALRGFRGNPGSFK